MSQKFLKTPLEYPPGQQSGSSKDGCESSGKMKGPLQHSAKIDDWSQKITFKIIGIKGIV